VSGVRVAVTGIGVVAPGGQGREGFWGLLMSGVTATRPISLFDASGFRSRIAAECDFDAVGSGLHPRDVERMDRSAQFAVVAAVEAVGDAGLGVGGGAGVVAGERVGVSIGSAVGCTMMLEEAYTRVSGRGARWVVDAGLAEGMPHLYRALVPSSIATEVAWATGALGPVSLTSTGCTSGLDAVGHGMNLVAEGAADVVVAGATDAPISPITVGCFDTIKATSANNADPARASRPFDRDRDGFVLGEGAAVVVLENAEHARRRGAHVYCELVGYAQRSNAFHMTGLRPDGAEMAEAIGVALGRAGLRARDVDYVNAHGSGTRQNDLHETAAFKTALGARAFEVPVSSIKSMIGHSLGAIGALEVAACALAIERDMVPPTANLDNPDPELGLDYVPVTARANTNDVVLSVGSGFGGFQSAMVLARPGAVTG